MSSGVFVYMLTPIRLVPGYLPGSAILFCQRDRAPRPDGPSLRGPECLLIGGFLSKLFLNHLRVFHTLDLSVAFFPTVACDEPSAAGAGRMCEAHHEPPQLCST